MWGNDGGVGGERRLGMPLCASGSDFGVCSARAFGSDFDTRGGSMTRRLRRAIGIASCVAAGFSCTAPDAAAAEPGNRAERFFDKRVEPILRKRCLGCHNEELKDGNVSVLDRDSLIKGGSRGPAIVPGRPEASVLILAVRHNGELRMPPGKKLPARQIAILTEWVSRGAVWGTQRRLRATAGPTSRLSAR